MTLHSIIEKQYESDEFFNAENTTVAESLRGNTKRLETIKILKGHFQFGIHNLWGDDFEYFTILRHPLERLISSYYFILETKDHYLHQELRENELSFYEYVTSGIVDNTENMMVRLIGGVKDAPYGTLTSEELEIAKSNLLEHFPIFGPLETFDKVLILLKQRYNWNVPYYQRIHATQSKEVPKLTHEQLDHIKSLNQLDFELYDFACQQFDELWKRDGNEKALSALKKKSKLIQTAGAIRRKLF